MTGDDQILRRLRELAALAAGAQTHALRDIHADHLRRAVAAARRQGVDSDEIETIISAATWAARAKTSRIARCEAIVGRVR